MGASHLELEGARARWRALGEDARVAQIARFQEQRLASLEEREAPSVALHLSPAEAEEAVRSGSPLLVASDLEVDIGELEHELHAVLADLLETNRETPPAIRALASAPVGLRDALAAALRGDRVTLESQAFLLSLPLEPLSALLELAVQPALWVAAAQAATLADLSKWSRGYCPVCGAWPLYGELVGPQRERHLRCGRCGTSWAWAVLLCPYCGEDDHRRLGTLENAEERESVRVDVCERCRGYVKSVAAFTPVPAPQVGAEDLATLHLDVAARERGYERPGHMPQGVPARAPQQVSLSDTGE